MRSASQKAVVCSPQMTQRNADSNLLCENLRNLRMQHPVALVEYEPDSELRDFEQLPLLVSSPGEG